MLEKKWKITVNNGVHCQTIEFFRLILFNQVNFFFCSIATKIRISLGRTEKSKCLIFVLSIIKTRKEIRKTQKYSFDSKLDPTDLLMSMEK